VGVDGLLRVEADGFEVVGGVGAVVAAEVADGAVHLEHLEAGLPVFVA